MALATLFYFFFAKRLITAICLQQSLPFLNRLAEEASSRPLDFYLRKGDVFFAGLLVLLALGVPLAGYALLEPRKVREVVVRFFTATAHPVNLAVFRICLFALLFKTINVENVLWFSRLPRELVTAPVGLEVLVAHLPINPTWAGPACVLFLGFSFLAAIGLFTRVSAWLCVLLGFYVLGIPQFFGKVNHINHLLWFGAILAVSPCADMLSADATLDTWRRAKHGIVTTPRPSRAYALPLRLIWILIGLIYFFPGLWKLLTSGLDWALNDNLKYQLQAKWFEMDGWMPFFRLDQYPPLYRLSGLGTLFFETSFVFLIFFDRLRPLAVSGGLMFHWLTNTFMSISFFELQACYPVFFNWHWIFTRSGAFLFPKTAYVLFDGNCRLCNRTVGIVRRFDVLERVIYLNALDKGALAEHGHTAFNAEALLKDMHVVVGDGHWKGFAGYRAWMTRIPLFWPFLPLLWLWPVPWLGDRVYRHVADSRSCIITRTTPEKPRFASWKPAAVVGGALIGANLVFGALKIVHGWPFACYPTFDWMQGPEIETIAITALTSDSRTVPLDTLKLGRNFSSEKFWGVMRVILSEKNDAQRRLRLKKFWKVLDQDQLQLDDVRVIRFSRAYFAVDPEKRGQKPVREKPIMDIPLADLTA